MDYLEKAAHKWYTLIMSKLKKAQTQSWANWIVGAFVMVAVLMGLCIAYFSFAKTTITITPNVQAFTAKVEIPLNQVDGAVFTTEKNGNLIYTQVTAEKEEPDFATGTVTLKNDTGADQPLVATTRLLSTEGVLFRTQEHVVVPAHGHIDVAVKADQPGAEGNIGTSSFEIVALHQAQKEKINGTSSAAMTGGVKKTGVLSANDVAAAEQQLLTDLTTQAVADLVTQVAATGKDTIHITDKTVQVEKIAQTLSAQIGDTVNSLTVTMDIKATTVSFDPVKLQSQVNTQAALQAPEGTQATGLPDYTGYSYTLSTEPTPPDQPIKIIVSVSGNSVIQLNSPLLDRTQIVNKDEQAIKNYFSNFEEVKDVQITFRPFWIKRAPALADHIVIQIVEPASSTNQ